MELPILDGSEKQIAWAEDIRNGWIRKFEMEDARLSERLKLHESFRAEGQSEWESDEAMAVDARIERERENLKELQSRILQDTSAKSWIDRRNLSIGALYSRIYKEAYI